MNDSKAAFLKEAALSRGDLRDAQWGILNPLLPDRGERGQPTKDKRPGDRLMGKSSGFHMELCGENYPSPSGRA
ncbi:MAG: transposase, partial [Blastocatellia bacterium]